MLNKTSHHLFSYHVISSPFRIMPSYYPHSCHIFISYQTHIIRIHTEKVINWKLNMQLLTHAMPLISFYTPWKHQKASSIKWVQTLIYLGLTNYNCILKSKRWNQNKTMNSEFSVLLRIRKAFSFFRIRRSNVFYKKLIRHSVWPPKRKHCFTAIAIFS